MRASTRRGRCRRPGGPVAAAMVTALGAAGLAGCFLFFRNPSVRIADVGVADVGLSGATAVVGLEVVNPNSFALTSTGLTYLLAFEDAEPGGGDRTEWRTIAEGDSRERVTVPAKDTSRITISVPFRYQDVGRAVTSFMQRGELRYRFQGVLRVDGPVGDVRVPFDETGDLRP